jgi:hypothetical protein
MWGEMKRDLGLPETRTHLLFFMLHGILVLLQLMHLLGE